MRIGRPIIKGNRVKRAYISILICLLLSLAACQSKSAYPWPLVESTCTIHNTDVSLSIVGDYLTQEEVLLCIENHSTEEIAYGRAYVLQIVDEGKWYDIDVRADWPADACLVAPGQRDSRPIDWSQIYGELPKGCYRIVQEYRKASETYFSAYPFAIE